MAGVCVLVSIAVIIFKRHKIKMDGEYVFYKDTEESKRLIAETEEKYRAYEDEKAAKKSAKAEKKIDSAEELSSEDRLLDDTAGENEEEEQEEISDGSDN